MASAAMCEGLLREGQVVRGCPRASECYRHTARPSGPYQVYLRPPLLVDGSCESFWPNNAVGVEGEPRG